LSTTPFTVSLYTLGVGTINGALALRYRTGRRSRAELRWADAPRASPVTHDETLTGTPLCMSPESITSPDAVDLRSDLYSLGAVAYFLRVGRPPFAGKSIVEICAAHLHVVPRSAA
jgi:serine/threonine protein kinase